MLITEIVFVALIIVSTIGLIVSMHGAAKCGKLPKRNEEVGPFRLLLLNLASEYNLRRLKEGKFLKSDDAYGWFLEKYTYDEMLYSKKPLTLEEWYTPEELLKIKS